MFGSGTGGAQASNLWWGATRRRGEMHSIPPRHMSSGRYTLCSMQSSGNNPLFQKAVKPKIKTPNSPSFFLLWVPKKKSLQLLILTTL
jgi:hypothetical protein